LQLWFVTVKPQAINPWTHTKEADRPPNKPTKDTIIEIP